MAGGQTMLDYYGMFESAFELKKTRDKSIRLQENNFQVESNKYKYEGFSISDNIHNLYFVMLSCRHDYVNMSSEEHLEELEATYIRITITGIFDEPYTINVKPDSEKIMKRFSEKMKQRIRDYESG